LEVGKKKLCCIRVSLLVGAVTTALPLPCTHWARSRLALALLLVMERMQQLQGTLVSSLVNKALLPSLPRPAASCNCTVHYCLDRACTTTVLLTSWGNSSYAIVIFSNLVYVIDISMASRLTYVTDNGISEITIFLVISEGLSLTSSVAASVPFASSGYMCTLDLRPT
jgi:hypothetical protein